MDNKLTKKQREDLKSAHRLEHNRRYADRIKAILLLDSGWLIKDITEALLLDEKSIWNYKKRYDNGGCLCDDNYTGRQHKLTDKELLELKSHLSSTIYSTALEITVYIAGKYEVQYTISGMRDLLHEIGFSYKKAKVVPGKADAAKQEEFLKMLEETKEEMGPDDKLYYMDGVHPQHNTVAGFAWIPVGEDFEIKSNTGRKRINLNGALDAQSHEIIIREDPSINAQSTIALLKMIERRNPDADTIFVIADNARYYRSILVNEFLENSKIEILFLPAYAPNLNLIERYWKFFKKKVLANEYYESYAEFKEAALGFFKKRNLKKYHTELDSLLTDNFQLIG